MTGVATHRRVECALDLGDDRLYASIDPEPMWRDLVAKDAIVWTEPGASHHGFFSVFSHQACSTVLAPESPFTSEYGMFIGFDRQHPDSGGGRMIVVSEGDWHDHLRVVMGKFFARLTAGHLQASVESDVEALLVELRGQAVSDIAGRLASWLPNTVVCELLDVPRADREWLRELTHYAVGAPDDPAKMSPSRAHSRIMFYFADLIQERRRRAGDDLISNLLHDGKLSPADVLVNCDNVFAAGNATTQHSVAGIFHALSTVPEALDAMRADPRQVRSAVDEVIRWSTPGPHVLRVATQDVVVNGEPVSKDTPVVSWLVAANRDGRVFPRPDELTLDRQPNRHLSFGRGLHYCLGAAMARMELKVLMEQLARTARTVSLEEAPQRLRSTKVNGYRRLPVRIGWR